MSDTEIEQTLKEMSIKDKSLANVKVKLQSDEGLTIETTMKCAKMSLMIKDMVESLDETESIVVPLAGITPFAIAKVVQWMERHQDEPQPTNEDIRRRIEMPIDEWDTKFICLSYSAVLQIVTAADFLHIPGLLWLSTRAVAQILKSRGSSQLRHFFNITESWDLEEYNEALKNRFICKDR